MQPPNYETPLPVGIWTFNLDHVGAHYQVNDWRDAATDAELVRVLLAFMHDLREYGPQRGVYPVVFAYTLTPYGHEQAAGAGKR